ncbi:uncharacterized protein SETTUDRAFT_106391, partial [Exserohilum turcica Et28A]
VEDRRNGYPRLAAFINSDLDFVVFRRFGHLHVRYLLYLQDEIAEMEQQLHTLDRIEPCSFYLNTRRRDRNQERGRILKTLGEKLFDYDKLLEMYYKHVERGPSHPKNVQSVANWMQGNKPLIPEESTFLNSWDDLVSPSERADHGGLNVLLKQLSHRTHTSVSRDPHVITVDMSLIMSIARALTTLLAVMILTIPISVLYNVKSMTSRLCIIGVSTGTFSSCLCVLTHSRHAEIFSATAAYCAVLVVFVSNIE